MEHYTSLQMVSIDAGAKESLCFVPLPVRLYSATAAVEECDGGAVTVVGALRGAPQLAQLQLRVRRARQLDFPVRMRARFQVRFTQNDKL